MDSNEYKYNLFLSWTGADRELKNQIRDFFVEKSGNPDYCYDSDIHCKGHFRQDYIEALYQSKVYLLILTDSLLDNEAEHLSEAQKELSNAVQLDGEMRLNVIPLVVSARFKNFKPSNRSDDPKGFFYYSNLQGYSQIYANVDAEGKLDVATLEKVYGQVADFVKQRDEGHPAMSPRPYTYVTDDSDTLKSDPFFIGRKDELSQIKQAFDGGAQVVVLSGMGGIGKTRLASQFAFDANADKTVKFLQIIHVQEMLTETNGLRLLVSETRWKEEFRTAYNNLPEDEKYRAKLNALKEIPEYCLLVLDNFNLASEDALYELVEQLNCRMLVTTRAHLDPDSRQQNIVNIHVDKLAKLDAYTMFQNNSNRTLSAEQFDAVWEAVKGHTITLCIMASILKKHKNKTVEELVDKINGAGLLEIKDTIRFSHNNSSQLNDILGHLKTLFDVSTLDGDCKDVLRNMSMISDGMISVADLQRYMHLDSDNAIVSLIDEGWLEERMLDDVPYVYLHPVISQLIFSIDAPTEDNVAGIIKYLVEFYDRQKEDLAYSDAHLMATKIFYAMYKLAANSKRLCVTLWDKYAEINRLLGDLTEIDKQRKALNALLEDEKERNLLDYFYDFTSLEAHPDDFSNVVMQYTKYTVDSSNYKQLLQLLPVVCKYATRETDLVSVRGIYKAILPTAIAQQDDFAVMSCVLNLSSKDYSPSQIKQYIQKRRSEGAEEGKLLLIEMCNAMVPAFGSYLECLPQLLQAMDDDSLGIKLTLRHPIFVRKMLAIMKKIDKLPTTDTMEFFWKFTLNMADSMVDDNQIDAAAFLENIVNVLTLLRAEGVTLLTYDEVIDQTVSVLKKFPAHMQGDLQSFVDVPLISADKITLSDMSKLNMACALSGFLADNSDEAERNAYVDRAVLQSKHILYVQKKLHSANNYRVIDALIRHGNLCRKYKLFDEAKAAFREAYFALKNNSQGQSAQLFDLCNAVLAGGYYINGYKVDLGWCRDVKETGMKAACDNSNILTLSTNYVVGLAELYGRARNAQGDFRDKIYSMIDGGLKELFEIVAEIRQTEQKWHLAATFAVRDVYVSLWNNGLATATGPKVNVHEFIEFFEGMTSSRNKRAAADAKQFLAEVRYKHSFGMEKIQYCAKAVDEGLSNRARLDGTVAASSAMVESIVAFYASDDSPDAPMLALLDWTMGRNKKLRDEFASLVSEYLSTASIEIGGLHLAMNKTINAHREELYQMIKELKGSGARRRANYYINFLLTMLYYADSK